MHVCFINYNFNLSLQKTHMEIKYVESKNGKERVKLVQTMCSLDLDVDEAQFQVITR